MLILIRSKFSIEIIMNIVLFIMTNKLNFVFIILKSIEQDLVLELKR